MLNACKNQVNQNVQVLVEFMNLATLTVRRPQHYWCTVTDVISLYSDSSITDILHKTWELTDDPVQTPRVTFTEYLQKQLSHGAQWSGSGHLPESSQSEVGDDVSSGCCCDSGRQGMCDVTGDRWRTLVMTSQPADTRSTWRRLLWFQMIDKRIQTQKIDDMVFVGASSQAISQNVETNIFICLVRLQR